MYGQVLSEHSKPIVDLVKRIVSELEKYGVPKNISGYLYLRKAILLTYQDFNWVHAITTKLYPVLAEEFDTKSSGVERCIRHAIDVAYVPGSEMAKKFSKKPTNGAVIAEIADQLRMEDGII